MQMTISVQNRGSRAGKTLTKITCMNKTNLVGSHVVCAHSCSKVCKEGIESHLEHQNVSDKLRYNGSPGTTAELSNNTVK